MDGLTVASCATLAQWDHHAHHGGIAPKVVHQVRSTWTSGGRLTEEYPSVRFRETRDLVSRLSCESLELFSSRKLKLFDAPGSRQLEGAIIKYKDELHYFHLSALRCHYVESNVLMLYFDRQQLSKHHHCAITTITGSRLHRCQVPNLGAVCPCSDSSRLSSRDELPHRRDLGHPCSTLPSPSTR